MTPIEHKHQSNKTTWLEACKEGFSKLLHFEGKMSRRAFLKYHLTILATLILLLLVAIFALNPTPETLQVMGNIFVVLLLLLNVAAFSRRYRDVGQSPYLVLALIGAIAFQKFLTDLDPRTETIIQLLLIGVQTYCIVLLIMPSQPAPPPNPNN